MHSYKLTIALLFTQKTQQIKDTVSLSHAAIFLASCNGILLLRDVN